MDSMLAFAIGEANRGKEQMVFDWDRAAAIIAERKPSLARAGLSRDWEYTGGTIWSNGRPVRDSGTYLASTWATPELEVDGETVACFRMASEVPGWDCHTVWPESALAIVNPIVHAVDGW